MAYPLHGTQQSNNYWWRQREWKLVLMNRYKDYIDTLYIQQLPSAGRLQWNVSINAAGSSHFQTKAAFLSPTSGSTTSFCRPLAIRLDVASPPSSPSHAPCSASSFSSDQFGLASRRCHCRHQRRHLSVEPVPAILLHRFLNNIIDTNNSNVSRKSKRIFFNSKSFSFPFKKSANQIIKRKRIMNH